jgi:hypothetical protein
VRKLKLDARSVPPAEPPVSSDAAVSPLAALRREIGAGRGPDSEFPDIAALKRDVHCLKYEMKRLKLNSACRFTEADRALLTRLDAAVAGLSSDSPPDDFAPKHAIRTMDGDPVDAVSRSLAVHDDLHAIKSEILELKREVGDASSGETLERLTRDVRCLKHEMRLMKLSGQPSAVFHALEEKVDGLAAALPERSIEEIRRDVEALRSAVGERTPGIEKLISLVSQEVRVILQSDIDRKLREAAAEKKPAEAAVDGWEREIEAIRREMDEIRGRLAVPPDFSQVFVDLPTVAAVQLVFRAGH